MASATTDATTTGVLEQPPQLQDRDSAPPPPKPEQAPSGHSEKHQKNSDHNGAEPGKDEHDTNPPPPHATSGLKSKITEKKHHIAEKANPPGGFDETPLPDFPPGFTVKITFHKAWNLPIADLPSAAADPFVHATINADVPKRHKEDPDLRHRTRTAHRTLEPEWNEDWIVANIPRSGFRIKCRLYDEDYPDSDDRLGNVTYISPPVDETWEGLDHHVFEVKKRSGSKRAYLLKAAESLFHKDVQMTPFLELSIKVLGPSDPPGAQMYTLGPTKFVQHFSPMIGRLTGIKVSEDSDGDHDGKKAKRYDFQANEMQLQGPVPPKLYHRYVEFKPFVGPMFSSAGLRGRLLNKVLHKQHRRIYNYDSSTKYGDFQPCSTEASLQFLNLVHFDEGGRIFTYVLTLDGLLRFTETGKEFGIDMLSKHTMHSNVETYIACSGEFFIRRKKHKHSHHHHHHDHDYVPKETKSHKEEADQGKDGSKGGEENGSSQDDPEEPARDEPQEANKAKDHSPPRDPQCFELIIDNDSGTYRPDKSILPLLQEFLEHNFADLSIRTMHCDDEELKALKEEQHEAKKKTGPRVRMVLNRSPSSSSISSSDESELSSLDSGFDGPGNVKKSKREMAWDALNDPKGGYHDLKEKLARRPKTAESDHAAVAPAVAMENKA